METKTATETGAEYGHVGDVHETQLALLNQIEKEVMRGAGPGAVAQLLDHFVEHANAHFLSEQLLMRDSSYSDYEPHVFEHDLILSQARQFLKDVETGETAGACEFVVTLRDWLVRHMRTTDAALESYLNRRPQRLPRGRTVPLKS
jgi:hemerythrin